MGRKIVTKETQEGCLSFLIISFSELFKVLKNLHRQSKSLFDCLRPRTALLRRPRFFLCFFTFYAMIF